MGLQVNVRVDQHLEHSTTEAGRSQARAVELLAKSSALGSGQERSPPMVGGLLCVLRSLAYGGVSGSTGGAGLVGGGGAFGVAVGRVVFVGAGVLLRALQSCP